MPFATLSPQESGSTKIVFEVSADKILNWDSADQSAPARYTEHPVHLQQPKKEFLGPGLSTVTLSILLDVERRVNVNDQLVLMRTYRDTGEMLTFVHGGRYIGDYVIEDVRERWLRTDVNGELTAVRVELRLGEYV